jgi:hypothetical protein
MVKLALATSQRGGYFELAAERDNVLAVVGLSEDQKKPRA